MAGINIPGVPSGAITDPTDIANLVLWLRADMGVATSGPSEVDSWTDQSASGLVFNENGFKPIFVASHAPLNNQPVINPTGGADRLFEDDYTAMGNVNDSTWFWVWDAPTPSGTDEFLEQNGAGTDRIYHVVGGDIAYDDGTATRSDTAAIGGVQYVTLTLNSATGFGNFRRNGAAIGGNLTYDGTFLTNPGSGMSIWGATGGAQNLICAEFIGYSRVLNSTEIGQVETYLATRYNL